LLSDRCCATSRAKTSAGPPAPNGTINFTGRSGYLSADQADWRGAAAASSSARAEVRNNVRIDNPPDGFLLCLDRPNRLVVLEPVNTGVASLFQERAVVETPKPRQMRR